MDTENNQENKSIDKPKQADEISDATLKPNTNDDQDMKIPAKKIKRQATKAELNHPLHGVKLAVILESLVEF